MDAFTAAALAEALGGITTEAVTPLLQRASRVAASRLKLRQPGFVEAYTAMLSVRKAEISVLPLYNQVPSGITLYAIKAALRTATAKGFIMQLTALHIAGEPGDDEQMAARDKNRGRVYGAFSDYLAEELNIAHVSQTSDSRIYVERQEFSAFASAALSVVDRYSRIAAECLTRDAKDRGYALSWAQAVQAQAILESIERYAAVAAGDKFPSFEKQNRWIESYRASFTVRHRNIMLPDLDRRRSAPYEELYVEPRLREEETEKTLGLDQLLRSIDRVVILGDPGAGKSTMSSVIAMRFVKRREYIPFHITMREINLTKSGFSVVQEVEEQLVSHYQIEAVPSLVEHLLNIGSAALIFDGLDELLDPSVRRQAASIIEVIAERFPLAPIVVTCRRVGYSQSQLEPEIFAQVSIEKFDELRIREYVTKWFTVSEWPTEKQAEQETAGSSTVESYVSDFMESSASIREMTANPLLLSFICVLYRGKRYIPRNRPQLFENCVDLLLRAWDVSRGVTREIADDTYELALTDVAEYIASSSEFQTGIPGPALKEIFATHLMRDASYPPARARTLATQMVEHCKNRAWIFCDVGLPGDQDERYAFTHSSFLEYFRAWSLTRRIADPHRLADELYGLLQEGRSQVTVQTAIHLCERRIKGEGSVCTSALVERIVNASTNELGREAVAAMDVVIEASDAIPLNVDSLFVLCKGLVYQIIGEAGRPGSDLLRLFGSDFRHRLGVSMIYSKVLQSLISREEDDLTRLRLCWLLTSADAYMPLGPDWSTARSAIEKFDETYGGFNSLLMQKRQHDLAWSLALKRGVLPEDEIMRFNGRRLLMRLFEPCSDRVSRIGNDTAAGWLIDTIGSPHRLSQRWVPNARITLRILGELLLTEISNNGIRIELEFPQEWIDHIRLASLSLLTSGRMSNALRTSIEFDPLAKTGLGFLVLASLDVFVELFPSGNVNRSTSRSPESYEEAFQVVYRNLRESSGDLSAEFQRYLTAWSCGQIWVPESVYTQDVS